jgi:hypothetical protein
MAFGYLFFYAELHPQASLGFGFSLISFVGVPTDKTSIDKNNFRTRISSADS